LPQEGVIPVDIFATLPGHLILLDMTEHSDRVSPGSKSIDTACLVWMDLEMSGLDPEANTILEIATVITDLDLEIISDGPVIAVSQPDSILESMDDWNKEHHSKTGLIARVKQARSSLQDAEMETLDFIKRYIAPNKAPLCGNSVWQDRRFLIKYMPVLEQYFHYRNIDVSSIKELYARWYPNLPLYEKENAHTALKDIYESISELRYYRRSIFVK